MPGIGERLWDMGRSPAQHLSLLVFGLVALLTGLISNAMLSTVGGGGAVAALAMTASVNGVELSRGSWADTQFSFGEMVARASADASLRPGDLIGSGTVGTGCLLEVRDEILKRYLEPGDVVTLSVDRLGSLTTPIVERPPDR